MNDPKQNHPSAPLYRKRYRFAPKTLPTMAIAVLLMLLVSLGFWQLGRADQKRYLLQQFSKRLTAKPLQLHDLGANFEAKLYAPLAVSGYFDNKQQILLDNKVYKGRVGYQVITPFIPDAGMNIKLGMRVLVNRGWVPLVNNRRSQLPVIKPVLSHQTIHGLVYLPPQKPLLLRADIYSRQGWPLRVQAVQIAKLAKHMGAELYPFVILLAPDAKNGFIRDWQPINMSPAKHTGYAVQWFAMAAVLLILFFVISIRKESEQIEHGNKN